MGIIYDMLPPTCLMMGCMNMRGVERDIREASELCETLYLNVEAYCSKEAGGDKPKSPVPI
jgi:hypothetical protein